MLAGISCSLSVTIFTCRARKFIEQKRQEKEGKEKEVSPEDSFLAS